ncbi:MAG: phenylacetate--CoA ligase family protein [Deltaproteobacteria bacterium]|nr:phenylacetate--CoA ligase family protein [Candidatus Anaeroferrophillacea bacterium]
MSLEERTRGYLNRERETADAASWQAWHAGKIKEICALGYARAPAVKRLLDTAGARPEDINGPADLVRLPVTPKSRLAAMQAGEPPFGGWLAVPVNELKRIFMSPGPIYDPQGRQAEYWGWAEGFYAAGFRPRDVVINTFGYQMTPAGLMFEESLLELGCGVLPTGVGNTEVQVGLMRDLGVSGFVGMASFLRKIGEKAREMGLNPRVDLKLEIGYVAAEILTDSLRTEVEEMFGMLIRQGYGTADCGCLGYECREANGMHFTSNAYVEIVDPQTGTPREPGEPGEVVVTLFNPVYPLIRFGTGDLAVHTEDSCPCGRTAPRILRIMGRVDQITKVKGMFVHPSQAEAVVARFPEVGAWQIVVTRENNMDIMTFDLEMSNTPADPAVFAAAFANAVQEGLKLKPVVNFVPAGAIEERDKKIRDERQWD